MEEPMCGSMNGSWRGENFSFSCSHPSLQAGGGGTEWGEGTLDCLFPTSCPQAALLAMTASSLGSQLPLHRPGQLPVPGRLFSSSVPPSRQGGNFLRSPQHLLLTCRICYNLVNQLPVFQSWFKYANILCSLARFWIQPFANV